MAPVSTAEKRIKSSKKSVKKRTADESVLGINDAEDLSLESTIERSQATPSPQDAFSPLSSSDRSIEFPFLGQPPLPLTSNVPSSDSHLSSTAVAAGNETDDPHQTPLRKESTVWQFAERTENNDVAKCKLRQMLIKTANWSTTGLRKHLSQVHKLPTMEPNAPQAKSEMSSSTKAELHNLAVTAIIKDGRSFNDFRRPGLLNFLVKAAPGNYIYGHAVINIWFV